MALHPTPCRLSLVVGLPELCYRSSMLTPKQCKEFDPSLRGIPDERLEAILGVLYGYAEFFWDQWLKEGRGVPKVSREAIEAELRNRVR
jgi:hypothetical protein